MRWIATLFLAAMVSLTTGCDFLGLRGNGVMETENRPAAEFSTLSATGAFDVRWSSGPAAVVVTADKNLLPHIRTIVSGGTLRIDSDQQLNPTATVRVVVSSGALKEAKVSGAVSLDASGLAGPDMNLRSEGAASIKFSGNVNVFSADLVGASSLEARELKAASARVSMAGASSGDVNVSDSLDASISGAGSLTYSGKPKSVRKSVTGAGSIQSKD